MGLPRRRPEALSQGALRLVASTPQPRAGRLLHLGGGHLRIVRCHAWMLGGAHDRGPGCPVCCERRWWWSGGVITKIHHTFGDSRGQLGRFTFSLHIVYVPP